MGASGLLKQIKECYNPDMKKHIFFAWLPLAIASTILFVTAYALVQQDMRLSANDPQIELAEETTAALSHGASPASILNPAQTDISKELTPFGIVYDAAGKVVASSGTLNGAAPAVPSGVLAYARTHADDRFTWQPAPGVRIAAVVRKYQLGSTTTGFILVGRSLREIELRESSIELIAALAWVIAMALTLIAVAYKLVAVKKGEHNA